MEDLIIMSNLNFIDSKIYKQEVYVVQKLFDRISYKLQMLWGIENEKNIKIYISRYYILYILKALPIHKSLLLLLFFPLWYFKVKKKLDSTEVMFGEKLDGYIVFLKPIKSNNRERLLDKEEIYFKSKSNLLMFERNACHIVVNVLVAPISLPYWLENGLIVFCSDSILGKPFLKIESLLLLKGRGYDEIISLSLKNTNEDKLNYNYTKGYWTVRYLEEEYPGFLKETFKSYKGEDVVRMIVEKLDFDTTDDEKMWGQLDEMLYNHYEHLLETE